jgi:hypothetical protein
VNCPICLVSAIGWVCETTQKRGRTGLAANAELECRVSLNATKKEIDESACQSQLRSGSWREK